MTAHYASTAYNKPSQEVVDHIDQHSIVIVDDSEDDRHLLLTTLKSFLPDQIKYHIFKNGAELLAHLNRMDINDVEAEEFESKVPQMIFLDLMMPEMNGIETLEKIRAQSLWCDVPITLITCSKNDFYVQQAELAGANAFMPKPFTSFDVVKTLNKASNYSPRIV